MRVAWQIVADIPYDANREKIRVALLSDIAKNLILTNISVKQEWLIPTEEEARQANEASSS